MLKEYVKFALAGVAIVAGCTGLAYMGPDHVEDKPAAVSVEDKSEALPAWSRSELLPPGTLPTNPDERREAIVVAFTQFPACEYEDSRNCAWDASERGNGLGRSFVDINGTPYYLDELR